MLNLSISAHDPLRTWRGRRRVCKIACKMSPHATTAGAILHTLRKRRLLLLLALSWLNLPSALKAAIVTVSGHLATLASLPSARPCRAARERVRRVS
jgi:hypothetical protein